MRKIRPSDLFILRQEILNTNNNNIINSYFIALNQKDRSLIGSKIRQSVQLRKANDPKHKRRKLKRGQTYTSRIKVRTEFWKGRHEIFDFGQLNILLNDLRDDTTSLYRMQVDLTRRHFQGSMYDLRNNGEITKAMQVINTMLFNPNPSNEKQINIYDQIVQFEDLTYVPQKRYSENNIPPDNSINLISLVRERNNMQSNSKNITEEQLRNYQKHLQELNEHFNNFRNQLSFSLNSSADTNIIEINAIIDALIEESKQLTTSNLQLNDKYNEKSILKFINGAKGGLLESIKGLIQKCLGETAYVVEIGNQLFEPPSNKGQTKLSPTDLVLSLHPEIDLNIKSPSVEISSVNISKNGLNKATVKKERKKQTFKTVKDMFDSMQNQQIQSSIYLNYSDAQNLWDQLTTNSTFKIQAKSGTGQNPWNGWLQPTLQEIRGQNTEIRALNLLQNLYERTQELINRGTWLYDMKTQHKVYDMLYMQHVSRLVPLMIECRLKGNRLILTRYGILSTYDYIIGLFNGIVSIQYENGEHQYRVRQGNGLHGFQLGRGGGFQSHVNIAQWPRVYGIDFSGSKKYY